MGFIKNELDYLKEDIKSLSKKGQLDENVIFIIKDYYNKRGTEYLKARIIILKNSLEIGKDINLNSIIAVLISIVSLIITISITTNNMSNNEAYNIVNDAIMKMNTYNEQIEENRRIVFSYSDKYEQELNECEDNNDYDRIDEIENILNNITEYKEAQNNIIRAQEKVADISKQAKNRMEELSGIWKYFNGVKITLVIGIITIIIMSLILIIKDIICKNKNKAIMIQINVIEEILNKIE